MERGKKSRFRELPRLRMHVAEENNLPDRRALKAAIILTSVVGEGGLFVVTMMGNPELATVALCGLPLVFLATLAALRIESR